MEQKIKLKAGSVLFLSEDERKKMDVGLIVLTGEELNKYPVGRFVVDLQTIRFHKKTLPLDYNHEPEEVLGSVGGFRLTEIGLEARGNLYSTADGDRAGEIMIRLQQGTPYEVSPLLVTENADAVELAGGETATVNGRDVEGPLVIFKNARLRGVAICPYGTDRMTNAMLLKLNKENDMTEEEKKDVACSDESESAYGAVPELESYIEEFGLDKGVEYYRQGVTFDEAKESDYQELKKLRLAQEEKKPDPDATPEEPSQEPEKKEEPLQLSALERKIDRLQKTVGSLQLALTHSEASPIPVGTSGAARPNDATFKMAERNATKIRQ